MSKPSTTPHSSTDGRYSAAVQVAQFPSEAHRSRCQPVAFLLFVAALQLPLDSAYAEANLPLDSPLPAVYERVDVRSASLRNMWNIARKREHLYAGEIDEAARRHDLPPALLRALILLGSGFDPQARSTRGRLGLMQLVPYSREQAARFASFTPKENIHEGAWRLRSFAKRVDNDSALVIAAHGFGEKAVLQEDVDILKRKEVLDYVQAVLKAHDAFVYLELREEPPSNTKAPEHGVTTRAPIIEPQKDSSRWSFSDGGWQLVIFGVLFLYLGFKVALAAGKDILDGLRRARHALPGILARLRRRPCRRCSSKAHRGRIFCPSCEQRACWESLAQAERRAAGKDAESLEQQSKVLLDAIAAEHARAREAHRRAAEERRRAEEAWRRLEAERSRRREESPRKRDPYEVLGLKRNAGRSDIRKAYLARMAEYHPDKVTHLGPELQELAARKARELVEAYEALQV